MAFQCKDVTNGKGTCSVCRVTFVYGDNNGDGDVSISDAVTLKKYLAGDSTTGINLGAADVNVDINVTVDDAVKLMKHLAGMNVNLGIAE